MVTRDKELLSPKLASWIKEGDLSPAAIDAFLESEKVPLVEGGLCTFLFRGHADEVRLRHWIFGLESAQPFHRLHPSDLWALTLELPAGSRVEYKLEVRQGDQVRLIRDPLNPQEALDPFGANSVGYGKGYQTPEWTQPDPGVREGTIEEKVFQSTALKSPRRVAVYLPARFRTQRKYPLLVVHDGLDFMQFAAMRTVLDNLIHRLEIPPMIVALSHPEDRLREYAHHRAHARFITEELVSKLESDYPLMGTPEGRGLMGASFGAVASLSTATHYPRTYGKLLLLSGSFAFTDIGENQRGPVFDPVVKFVNKYRAKPKRVASKVFLSCGMYESLIYENRSLLPLLQTTGMEIRYVEARDGHNWENWRDRLREGLSWSFPGPLWMVYE